MLQTAGSGGIKSPVSWQIMFLSQRKKNRILINTILQFFNRMRLIIAEFILLLPRHSKLKTFFRYSIKYADS